MKKLFFTLLLPLFLLCACQKPSLLPYVSENRKAVYLGSNEGVTIKACLVDREYPFATDGMVGELSPIIEVSVTLPDKPDLPTLSFALGDKTYGGELSYDTVSGNYTFSCTATTDQETIDFTVAGKKVTALKMNKTDNTALVLQSVAEQEEEFLSSFRSGRYFLGEIHVRVIFDDGIYYYVGFIDTKGNTTSFLTDEQGKILARRT